MPFLRLVDKPPFYAIEEILDFADQFIEVTTFVPLSQVQAILPRISSGSRFYALKGRCA